LIKELEEMRPVIFSCSDIAYYFGPDGIFVAYGPSNTGPALRWKLGSDDFKVKIVPNMLVLVDSTIFGIESPDGIWFKSPFFTVFATTDDFDKALEGASRYIMNPPTAVEIHAA
jgi:hypothetical protein